MPLLNTAAAPMPNDIIAVEVLVSINPLRLPLLATANALATPTVANVGNEAVRLVLAVVTAPMVLVPVGKATSVARTTRCVLALTVPEPP